MVEAFHGGPVRDLGALLLHRRQPVPVLAEQAGLVAVTRLGGGLADPQQTVDRFEDLAPVGVQAVERPRANQVLELLAIGQRPAEPLREIELVPERPARFAFGREILHRLRADLADRCQGVADRFSSAPVAGFFDRECGGRAVDVGRQQRDVEALQFLADDAELVRVAEVQRHQGGKELDRVIGLQPGGLVGDQRIGCGVRLVEAVARELVDLLEDLARLRFVHAARDRALDESAALGVHLGLDLLAHRPAQQVGPGEAEAGQLLRDLHHLLLVDDHAEGLAQDVLQVGVQVVGCSRPCLQLL